MIYSIHLQSNYFPHPSPDFDPADDLVMSYFSSSTSSRLSSIQEVVSDRIHRQWWDTKNSFLICPWLSVPSPHLQSFHSQSQAVTVKRKVTRKASGPLKILIVEDDPLCQQLISHHQISPHRAVRSSRGWRRSRHQHVHQFFRSHPHGHVAAAFGRPASHPKYSQI